jgi:hypothetical protein
MKRHDRVALVLAFVFLSSGIALGQARLGPYVVDANGLKVGHVQDSGNILMFFDGNPALVSAGVYGFNVVPFNLYFIDAACGTEAIMDVGTSNPPLLAPAFYTTDGVVHYVQVAGLGIAPILSFAQVNSDGTLGDCAAMTGSINAGTEGIASVTGFAPPFSVVDTLPVSPAPGTATFNDVPTNHPFFRYVEALYASGITAGCGSNNFCPDAPVTRGQMSVFLAKALGL